MAPGVDEIVSSLTSQDLEQIRAKYNIPTSDSMVVPGAAEKANSPPVGYITVYEVHLKGGLRFPVPAELRRLMKELAVPLVKLQPNAIRYLVSLCVFARCHGKTLEAVMVKIMFRFNQTLEWIAMTPRPEFAEMSGGNPDSTKRWKDRFFFLKVADDWELSSVWGNVASKYGSDVTDEERETAREVTDLVLANLGGFSAGKKNIWLSPEKLTEAKWTVPSGDSAIAVSKKKKKKKLRKTEGPLVIQESSERPPKSPRVEVSGDPPGVVVESYSEDDHVIAPMVRATARLTSGPSTEPEAVAAPPSGVEVHPETLGALEETVLDEVIEPHEAEAVADVTAGEIFDLLGGEEAMAAALEVPVVVDAPEVVEPPTPVGPPSEAILDAPAVPAKCPLAPEVFEGIAPTEDPVISQLQDLLGGINRLVGKIARSRREAESLKAVQEENQRLRTALASTEEALASSEEALKLSEVRHGFLTGRILQLEEAQRTSVQITKMSPVLESKFWDGIHLCRRVMQILHPQFPTTVLDPRNAGAVRPEDVFGLWGRPFPESSAPSPSAGPRPSGQPGNSSRGAGPSSLGESSGAVPPQGPCEG